MPYTQRQSFKKGTRAKQHPFQDNHRSAAPKSIRRTIALCWLAAGAAILCLPHAAVAADADGAITGRIVDSTGREAKVGGAVVFLLDADTGRPMLPATRKPFEPSQLRDGVTISFWFAETTPQGEFEFADVPPGRYRLLAQAWSGTQGLPASKDKSNPPFMFKKPSATITLLGVAEDVAVKPGQTTKANPKALGSGTLKIINDPEEDHAFLLISTAPRLGPGVLGPAAWGPEFLKGLVGYTQMEDPHVTIQGLPDAGTIHVGLMNYDNNPGIGGDTYEIGKQAEVRLNIYATWSNGKSEPPKHLLPLTDYLEANNLKTDSVLGLTGTRNENRAESFRVLQEEPDRMVQIGDLGEFRIADILAASAHRDLRKYHRERRERAKRRSK